TVRFAAGGVGPLRGGSALGFCLPPRRTGRLVDVFRAIHHGSSALSPSPIYSVFEPKNKDPHICYFLRGSYLQKRTNWQDHWDQECDVSSCGSLNKERQNLQPRRISPALLPQGSQSAGDDVLR